MWDSFIEVVHDFSEFLICFGSLIFGLLIFYGLYKCCEIFYESQLSFYDEPWYKALWYWIQDTWMRIVFIIVLIVALVLAVCGIYQLVFIQHLFW